MVNLNEKINENKNLKNQLEHMNTFANQVREMKQMIIDKGGSVLNIMSYYYL